VREQIIPETCSQSTHHPGYRTASREAPHTGHLKAARWLLLLNYGLFAANTRALQDFQAGISVLHSSVLNVLRRILSCLPFVTASTPPALPPICTKKSASKIQN